NTSHNFGGIVSEPSGWYSNRIPAAPLCRGSTMPRPPLAREKVLDAFEAILIEDGERAATLDAAAEAAGVPEGLLPSHFGSTDGLEAALMERLDDLTPLGLERMSSAEEGPVAYYVRTSVLEDDALDRALTAATRLAQGGSVPA